jgi:cytochrome bd-type quinol oxidase subunit 2
MRRIVRLLPLSFKGESMERKTSRNLFLSGIVLAIIATILFVVSGGIAAANATPDGQVSGGAASVFVILSIVAVVIYIVAGILAFIAWIGALIKTARLGEWVWFILLLILGGTGIMMLVYIFAGPTKPADSGQMS